ncbi:hypothetical protein [Emticicia sp. TH156]|uniref:hypothetical protein n=1 Tax=Emticicia sp. TH156 TaxID=2067454 RepID=UPI000C77579E|nr:hypothetical protein [Emticicia sp. TH156]PLK43744.1 hypothetical protein C0V77_14630 [Emticicia sp. TH156]
MPILLGFINIIGLFLYIRDGKDNGNRVSFIKSLLAFSVFVFLVTEVSAFFNCLNSFFLIASYLLLALFLCRVVFLKKKWAFVHFNDMCLTQYLSGFNTFFFVFLFLVLGFLTFYVTPNNTDALNYHLARADFWIQNQNLQHYPTTSPFQLYYNVMSEYFLLHTLVLAGGDYFVNAVQFVSMAGTLVAASLIGQLWGVSKKGQGLAAILVFSIPMGVVQSTTSQNDYLASFYFICFLFFGSLIFKNKTTVPNRQFYWAIVALMLGGFTKYTTFIYSIGFIVLYAVFVFKNNWKAAIKIGFISVGLFLITFSAFFYRNFIVFGNILMPSPGSLLYYNYRNEQTGLKVTLSNLSKIVGNHIGLPFNSWNYAYDSFIQGFHQFIGYDLNNQASTFAKYNTLFSIGEDFSGNFIHFFLLLFCACWFVNPKNRQSQVKKTVLVYFSLAVIGLISYASIFKWQTFHSRTQLPFFIGAMPVAAFIGMQIIKDRNRLLDTLITLLLISTLPFVFCNTLKPIIPAAYFFKKALVYVPHTIGGREAQLGENEYKELTGKGYYTKTTSQDFANIAYQIKPDVSLAERKEIFRILDRTTYYDFARHNIFERKEWKQGYFTFDDKTYKAFNGIFASLRNNDHNLGLALETNWVHPFFMYGKSKYGSRFRFGYVKYPPELKPIPNAQKSFTYSALVTDDSLIINKLAPVTAEKKQFDNMTLLLLQKPVNEVFYK